MMFSWRSWCLAGAVLMFSGLTFAAEQDDPVFAEIAGESFRISDLRTFIQKRPAVSAQALTAEGIREAVAEFVDSKVFRHEGVRLGISSDPGIPVDNDGYYFKVQFATIEKCPTPSDDEARRFFDANPARFATPAFVRVARVALRESDSIDGEPATLAIAAMLAKVRSGEMSFSDVVARAGEAAKAEGAALEMGDLGFIQLRREEIAANDMLRKLAEAKSGELIGPVTQDGHVFAFEVLDRREPVLFTWDGARNDAKRQLVRECQRKNLQAKRAELYARYQVTMHEAVVAAIKPTLQAGR